LTNNSEYNEPFWGPSNGEVLCTHSDGVSLDLPCACWPDFFLLQVHLHDAPCAVSVMGKGKVEPVLN